MALHDFQLNVDCLRIRFDSFRLEDVRWDLFGQRPCILNATRGVNPAGRGRGRRPIPQAEIKPNLSMAYLDRFFGCGAHCRRPPGTRIGFGEPAKSGQREVALFGQALMSPAAKGECLTLPDSVLPSNGKLVRV